MIDTHCHLDDLIARCPLAQVLMRAQRAGVSSLITVGVAPTRWPMQKSVALHARQAGCSVGLAYGIHPWWAHEVDVAAGLAALSAWLVHEACDTLAVGEIGLDFAPNRPPMTQQMALFEGQIALAIAHNLPVILHERKSADQLLKVIRRTQGLRGLVHGFVGSRQQAKAFIAQGFYLGVGTAITHPRAVRLRAMLASLPVERLLLESDAPNQPGALHKAAPNEPAFMGEQLAVLAEVRGEEPLALGRQLDANAVALFGRGLTQSVNHRPS
jgi:TatD DNase family protein